MNGFCSKSVYVWPISLASWASCAAI